MPPTRRALTWTHGLALAGLLLAAGLRFYRIEAQSYWNDEGNSRVLAARDVPTLLRNAAADIHPPGYYLILKVWRGLLGESEFALRSFSALAGVVLVAALYRLGRLYFGAGAALLAAWLAALNPFLIYYAQEARMYALLAAVSAASFVLLAQLARARIEDGRAARQHWRLIAGYLLVTALGLYTHYAFGFVIIAQNLIVGAAWLAAPRRGLALGWLALQAGCLVLFAPWLPTAYHQLTSWPAAREFPAFASALLDLTRYLAFGRTLPSEAAWAGLAAVGALLALGLWRGGRAGFPAAVWLLAPAALTLTFGLLTEAFSKFLLVAVPPLCLLVGVALAGRRGETGKWRRGLSLLAAACALVVLFFTAQSLNNLYFNPAYFRDDYRGIARYLQQIARPGDAVITDSPNQIEAFAYYHPEHTPGLAPVFPLPDTRPLDPARTAAQLTDLTAHYERVFVLYWGDQQADPGRYLESWLNTNTFKAGDQWFGQVRLATYAAARPAAQPATATAARFGDSIHLAGYTLKSADLAPGDILQVTLFWQTQARLSDRYKVFVHLYAAPDAPPVAQQDGEPGGGLGLTTAWQPGQTYPDNHGILVPADLPAGPYRLMIGLYNLADGTRLPLFIRDTIQGDRLDLGPVTIH